jgi:hypothetical protein
MAARVLSSMVNDRVEIPETTPAGAMLAGFQPMTRVRIPVMPDS